MSTITIEEFNKAKKALEDNNLTNEEYIDYISKKMEEMANTPKESLGKRQPGEKCKYEQYTEDKART